MIFLGPDNTVYRFSFIHERFDQKPADDADTLVPTTTTLASLAASAGGVLVHTRKNGDDATVRGRTICIVKDAADALIAKGESWCSVLDNYDKERGRSIAVHRAAEGLNDRTLRGRMLLAYYTRNKPPQPVRGEAA